MFAAFASAVVTVQSEEQHAARELLAALRHGTDAQRRRLLQMHRLPPPADIEAVAVPGIAVLDVPSAEEDSHSSRSFDPLRDLTERYDRSSRVYGNNTGGDLDRLDYSAFIEVLCPDGSSLLESLPLTPLQSSQRSLSLTALPATTPAKNHQAHPESMFDDAARASGTPSSESSLVHVFASGGSLALPSTNSSGHRRSKHASHRISSLSPSHTTHTTPALQPNSTRSLALSEPASPHEPPSPAYAVASAPTAALALADGCSLGGRILLTDRLVQTQANTALPEMISAYQQYVQATAANSPSLSSCASLSLSPSRAPASLEACALVSGGSEEEQLAVIRKALAPRQRGIVLQCSGTDAVVLSCVAEAELCLRPSFRRVDPADLYGSSAYTAQARTATAG